MALRIFVRKYCFVDENHGLQASIADKTAWIGYADRNAENDDVQEQYVPLRQLRPDKQRWNGYRRRWLEGMWFIRENTMAVK